MPRSTSFALTDHFNEFIEKQVKSGRYGSASDVVREGLRLLERREAELAALDRAIEEGETSGFAVPFDFEEFREEMTAKYARRNG